MESYMKLMMLLLAGLFLFSCQDDPEFPDPKFDSAVTRTFDVRRDTAKSFSLTCWMDVPNGINFIEILDGQSYQQIEKLEQYQGIKELEFSYPVDISNIAVDSSMAFIVKVYDLKNRTYNKAFVLNVKKFSIPEIDLVSSEITSVLLSAASLEAQISTGMIPIRHVIVTLDGEEVFKYVPERDTTDYTLNYLIENLNELKKYDVRILLEDVKGRQEIKLLTIFRIDKVERPVMVKVTGSVYNLDVYLTYGSKNELVNAKFGDSDINFTYDWGGYLKNIEATTDGGLYYVNYGFQHNYIGKIERVTETWGRGGIQGVTIAENVTFNNYWSSTDYRINSFVSGAGLLENIAYETAFGENIFAECWINQLPSTRKSERARLTGFRPVVIPTYLSSEYIAETCPNPLVYVYPSYYYLFQDLFFMKYVPTSIVSYLDLNKVLTHYSYKMDTKGRLSEMHRLNTDAGARSDHYWFVYADEL